SDVIILIHHSGHTRDRHTFPTRRASDLYDLDFAAQSPEEFVRTHFVEALRARIVVVGDDVRFGKDNEGTIDTLRRLGERYGFRTDRKSTRLNSSHVSKSYAVF